MSTDNFPESDVLKKDRCIYCRIFIAFLIVIISFLSGCIGNNPTNTYLYRGKYLNDSLNENRTYYVIPKFEKIYEISEDFYYSDTEIYNDKIYLLEATYGRIKTYIFSSFQNSTKFDSIPTPKTFLTPKNIVNKSFFINNGLMYILQSTYSDRNQFEKQNLLVIDLDSNKKISDFTIQPSSIQLNQVRLLDISEDNIQILCSSKSFPNKIFIGKSNSDALIITEDEIYSSQKEILCWHFSNKSLTIALKDSIYQYIINRQEIPFQISELFVINTDIPVSNNSRILFDPENKLFILHDLNEQENSILLYQEDTSNPIPIRIPIKASIELGTNPNQLLNKSFQDKNSFLILTYDKKTNVLGWTSISTRKLIEERYKDLFEN